MFVKKVFVSMALAATAMLAAPAHAGVYQDDLGKCLVKNSTAQDKQVLTQWIFFAIALNPQLNSYSNIPQDKREAADKAIAGLFSRLVGDACANEAKLAIKYEGVGAFRGAFELLGQIAGRELFAAPEVASGTSTFTKYLDSADLQKKLDLPKK